MICQIFNMSARGSCFELCGLADDYAWFNKREKNAVRKGLKHVNLLC